MKLESYQETYDNLKLILTSMNVESASLEVLTRLLAEAKYTSMLTNISLAKESSIDSCKLLNSAINHARNNMYHVDRGKNQVYLISDVVSDRTTIIPRLSPIAVIDNYKLYNTEELHLVEGKPVDNSNGTAKGQLELVVGDKLKVEVPEISRSTIASVLTSNISESYVLTSNNKEISTINNNYTPIKENAVTDITDVDYGVSFYKYEGWSNKDKLELKYLEYLDQDIDSMDISNINGFNISNSTVSIVPRSPRQEDVETIKERAIRFSSGLPVVKSNNDMAQVIKDIEPLIVDLNLVLNNTTSRGSIDVYYVADRFDVIGALAPIPSARITQIKDTVQTASNLPEEFTMHLADLKDTYKGTLNIKYINLIPSTEIDDLIKKYKLRVNTAFNINEFIGEVIKLDEVSYVELQSGSYSKVDSDFKSYINIDLEVIYERSNNRP